MTHVHGAWSGWRGGSGGGGGERSMHKIRKWKHLSDLIIIYPRGDEVFGCTSL